MTIKTGDVARRLQIHENTVRAWADQYSQFFSPGAVASKRKYSEDDIRVLATILEMRDAGIKPADITEALQNGRRVDVIPPPVTNAETEARRDVQLIPLAEYKRSLDEIVRLNTQIDTLTFERDRAVRERTEDAERYNQQIATIRQQLGQAEGELKAQRLWLMVSLGAIAVAAFAVAVALMIALR